MPRRTVGFAIGATCLVGVMLMGARWFSSPAQVRHLPDGSKLTLRSVTYGQRHLFRLGNRPRDYLGPLLSEGLARKLGCNFVGAGGSNALLCRFDLERAADQPAPRLRAAPFDQHGCEFRVVEASPHPFGTGTRDLVLVRFDEFPRRGQPVGLRLFLCRTNGGFAQLAEFTVPNLDKRSFPVWAAAPLPCTQTVGSVGFTLLEMKAGIYGRSFPPLAHQPGEDCGTLLHFQVSENGKPTPAWVFSRIKRLSDPAGHSAGGGSYSSGPGEGEFRTVIAGGLCLEEPAWRVLAEFARAKDFPPGDLWIIRGVLVPDMKSASVAEVATNLHGAQFRLRGIVGKDCPAPPARRSIGSTAVAHVVCPKLPAECDFSLLSAVDDRRRPVPSRGSSVGDSDCLFALDLPPDAKTVDLTFVVTRRVAVEFLAKPSRMTVEDIKKLRKELHYE